MRLQRDDQNSERTFGTLTDDDGSVIQTLEPPLEKEWPEGRCIPAGTYTCRLRYSPKHGYAVYGLLNVPGFHDVEIHPGNDVLDTLACILTGDARGQVEIGGKLYDAVLNSRRTFLAFMTRRGVANYRDLRDWDSVREFIAAYPGVAEFTLEVADAA